MSLDSVRTLSDVELSELEVLVQEEKKTRAERRKEDAIAKIKALAASVDIKVAIGGVRGRPARIKPDVRTLKTATGK